MKKAFLLICLLAICLAGCGCKFVNNLIGLFDDTQQSETDIVGFTNNGVVDKSKMTEIEFERIHCGAATILGEEDYFFEVVDGYAFPYLIKTAEEWELLQKKLNIDMEDIDFDKFIVYGIYDYDFWDEKTVESIMIKEMAYDEHTLYYGWRTKDTRKFEPADKSEKLCCFDLLKIERSDFPTETKAVYGALMDDERSDNSVIYVDKGGYYLLY